MRKFALHCVAVCTFCCPAIGSAQWFGEAPPTHESSEIERLPAPDGMQVEEPVQPLMPNANPPQDRGAAEPEAIEVPAEEVIVEEFKNPWSGSVEFGLNGSDGNNDIFNFRFGVDLERKTDFTKFNFDLDYKNDSTDYVQTANRLFMDARQEWPAKKEPWSFYTHGTTEYDDFKDFDTRIAGDAGVVYNFIKTDISRLSGRAGLGTSREFGGMDDEWIPEGSLGLDLEREISKLQKFTMSVDYFPNLTDFRDARITTKLGYKIVIDAETNLSLKLGLADRYDSTPGDAMHNDLDYSAVLLWSF